jgi:hypothetical protein
MEKLTCNEIAKPNFLPVLRDTKLSACGQIFDIVAFSAFERIVWRPATGCVSFRSSRFPAVCDLVTTHRR